MSIESVHVLDMLQWNSPLGYYFFPDIQTNGNVHVHIRNDFKLRVDDVENVPFAVSKLHIKQFKILSNSFETNIKVDARRQKNCCRIRLVGHA